VVATDDSLPLSEGLLCLAILAVTTYGDSERCGRCPFVQLHREEGIGWLHCGVEDDQPMQHHVMPSSLAKGKDCKSHEMAQRMGKSVARQA
jgi:hypothetical protein